MTVGELIEQLSSENPKMRVIIEGYEQGYDEVHVLEHVHVVPNTDSDRPWWDGELNRTKNKEAEIALLFPRGKLTTTK